MTRRTILHLHKIHINTIKRPAAFSAGQPQFHIGSDGFIFVNNYTP